MNGAVCDRRLVGRYSLLFICVYMVSYITRISYSAIVSEMAAATGNAASALGLALTGSAVTYGTGQIICGVIGDRVSPKTMITVGFSVATLMNLAIPFCSSSAVMTAVWCVNGFAQAFMWPPLVRLMTALFSAEDYRRATTRVSYGSSIGTILIYLTAPLLISLFGWRSVFFFAAAPGAVMLVLWRAFAPSVGGGADPSRASASAEKAAAPAHRGFFSPVLLGIMVAIALQGMLRDGVTTWMPSYISETFGLSRAASILTGVVLPLFAILCFALAARLHERFFRSPVACAGVFYGAVTLFAFLLYLLDGCSAILSVVLSALLTGCVHGVNLMLVCMIPHSYRARGSVSTVTGVLNSSTYIGSAVSTYGVARIAETVGWRASLLSYFLIALLGTVITVLCIRPWAKTHKALTEE